MVVIEGEAVKVDTCSLIKHPRQQKEGRRTHEFIPEEIWLEILSRLSIKSLFISQSVCKLWRNFFFTLYRKIDTDPLGVPVCGLLILSFRHFRDLTILWYWFSYFCLVNKRNFIIRGDLFENNSIFSSGFESGLLSDFSFDFSILHKVFRTNPEWRFLSFVMHGGLLLLTSKDDDCTSIVCNPATKQIYIVPNSQFVRKYGFHNHVLREEPGLIIQLPSCSRDQKCRFMVVRFCCRMRIMEVYYSKSRRWVKYQLKLDDEIMSKAAWHLQQYAAFKENGVLSLYVVTNKGYGIAIKFKGRNNAEMKQYCFPLPKIILEGYCRERVWECEGTLYLTYYMYTGLWIWKANSTEVDTWEWIPVLEISPSRQSCMPVVRKHLSELVLDEFVRVMPLALHPNLPILYLLVKSNMFAYNLKADTLVEIGEIKDFERRTLGDVNPFKPCFNCFGEV